MEHCEVTHQLFRIRKNVSPIDKFDLLEREAEEDILESQSGMTDQINIIIEVEYALDMWLSMDDDDIFVSLFTRHLRIYTPPLLPIRLD